jgi:FAD synthetase
VIRKKNSKTKTPIVVLATGAFDLLHPGHLKFLEASKRQGGAKSKLIVIVARDATVRLRKGRSPILSEQERLQLVSALKIVDKAMLGHPKLDLLGILREVKPDIVGVGYDQKEIASSVRKVIRDAKLSIRVVQMPKFHGRLDSSSKVKQQIFRKH